MRDPVREAKLKLAGGLAVFLILFFGYASCVAEAAPVVLP